MFWVLREGGTINQSKSYPQQSRELGIRRKNHFLSLMKTMLKRRIHIRFVSIIYKHVYTCTIKCVSTVIKNPSPKSIQSSFYQSKNILGISNSHEVQITMVNLKIYDSDKPMLPKQRYTRGRLRVCKNINNCVKYSNIIFDLYCTTD